MDPGDQLPIDWTKSTHELENNQFSQKNLDKNRHKFTGQAAYVLTALQQGKRLNSDYAREILHIKHLPRRIADLGDKLAMYIDREHGLNSDLEQEDELIYFLPDNRGIFIRKKWIIDRPYRWWYSKIYTDPKIIQAIELEKRKREAARAKNKT